MTTLDEAVMNRHSVRRFTEQTIDASMVKQLNDCIAACNAESGLHIQLVTNEPKAFGKSLMAHYGRFRNVRNYICLVGSKTDATKILLGYYGEKVVLLAQQLGLNTCWVGLSYNKKNATCEVLNGEMLLAVIALGYGELQGIAHKSKLATVVGGSLESSPDWYLRGIEYALLAPTAMNQQKFCFKLQPNNIVEATSGRGTYTKMDLGIAKLHFEIGAGTQNFSWK